ncbi:MAG TPA: multidrug effflux MFS transporter [Humibacillus xanthopallidus]|nr:multidrug effflux MFS transporter [Humibacillus xanthopallidus]
MNSSNESTPDRSTPATTASSAPLGFSTAVLATVVLVSTIAPLATDMYVPAFPRVGADLQAAATQVQLTLTTFFVGMALGQLVGGPVSDARGRRRPLLVALAVLTVASIACAFSPTIQLMMVARFVQGLSGGWAMVTARAVVVDLAQGDRLVRSLNLMAGVGGVAPIVGPLLGAVILQLTHWRVSFWVVAGLAALMFAAVAAWLPESLAADQRHEGGLTALARSARHVTRSREFVGHLVVMALSMGVIFAYVATSAFILQGMNGLSPVAYSIDFAANAVGLMVATLIAARLAGRVRTRAVIGAGLVATALAGLLLLAGALWWGMPLPVALVGFFVLMSAQGLVGPNAGALASAAVPTHPGTGSALLGFFQWCAAGVVAPLAGLGGDRTAAPMAVIVIVLAAASAVALLVVARHPPAKPGYAAVPASRHTVASSATD